MKTLAVVALTVALALPVWAGEQADCSRWSVSGLQPGMTFEAATKVHGFIESLQHRESYGYGRFNWLKKGTLESISLHVDTNAEPRRVIGVAAGMPEVTYSELVERWGEPQDSSSKANHLIFNWRDPECEISVAVHTTEEEPEVVLTIGISSDSARAEHARRKRAAADEAAAAEAESKD